MRPTCVPRDLPAAADARSRTLVPELAAAFEEKQGGPFTYLMGQGGQVLYPMPDNGARNSLG